MRLSVVLLISFVLINLMLNFIISFQYLEAFDLYFLWMSKHGKADNESDAKYCIMKVFLNDFLSRGKLYGTPLRQKLLKTSFNHFPKFCKHFLIFCNHFSNFCKYVLVFCNHFPKFCNQFLNFCVCTLFFFVITF